MRLTASAGLGRAAIRGLAERHGIRPTKALGQNFLVDPNLARAIAADVGAAPGCRVLEIGAGLGSLTVALAEAGAEVLAIEFDRALVPALADAMRTDWATLIGDGEGWAMASNLPYNVAVPLILDLLERAPRLSPLVVMVQREVADRLCARVGSDAYGAVSVKVAYHATARTLRAIPADVFWPAPSVASAVVRLESHGPTVSTDRAPLFRVIDESFAQRRKTMGNALRRLGVGRDRAAAMLAAVGVAPDARAEELDLADFARITEALLGEGFLGGSPA